MTTTSHSQNVSRRANSRQSSTGRLERRSSLFAFFLRPRFWARGLSIVAIFATSSWFYVYYPEEVNDSVAYGQERLRYWFHERELRVEGLKAVSRDALLGGLPLERNNLWWRINVDVLEMALRGHPLIENAEIHPCTRWSLRCFEIQIEERKPSFVAFVGEGGWIVGSDGGVIAPLSREMIGRYYRNGVFEADEIRRFTDNSRTQLPIVYGLGISEISSDVARSYLERVKAVIQTVESESARRISTIEMFANGTAEVDFVGLGCRVIFHPYPAAHLEGEVPPLDEQVRRFRKLIEVYGASKFEIESIDLAFEKIAVVKMKTASSSSSSFSSKKAAGNLGTVGKSSVR